MARSADALVEPTLLVWARESAGVDVEAAAKRVGVTAERVDAWEAGESRPTVVQLRSLAALYKRPLAIFYLPEPPIEFMPLRDYRRLPDSEMGRLSPRLLASIRRAQAVREAALELRDSADETIAPAPQAEVQESDPEALGGAARRLLGVSLATQFAWRDPGRALNAWIDAVARLDVLVLQAQAIPIDEMRGFSISEELLPVIVLNGGDFPNGRIFTLLHEVAHLLLRTGGVCDVLPRARPRHPADELEVLCNQIAAAALMPAEAFRGEPEILVGAPDGRWKESVVTSLAGRYSVSREAVVRRLFTLGLTDWGYLRSKQAEYRADYDEYRADQRRIRQEEDKPGGPGFYRMKVRDLGRGYIESALDAYHRRAITGSTLTELLEMKVSQIPRLEAELASTGGSRD